MTTVTQHSALRRPSRRMVLGLTAGQFIATMSTSMIATSLPTILGDLGGESLLAWTASITLLAATVAGPSLGKLSDTYGRRPIFTVTMTCYVIGATLAACAQTMWQFILGLGIQGVGIGGLLVMTQVLLSDMTSPRERGRYIGYVVMGYAAGSLGGPLIGGVLVEAPWLGWRLCFVSVIVLAVAAMAAVYSDVPTRQTGSGPRGPVDVLGMLTLAVTTVCLLVTVNFAGRQLPWDRAGIWLILAAGLVGAACLVQVERKALNPLLDRSVLWSPLVRRCLVLSVITSGLMYTTLFLLPQYLQVTRNLSPAAAAGHLLPMLVTQIILTPLVGRWVARRGEWRPLLRGGVIILTAGIIIIGTVRGGSNETVTLVAAMTLIGVGLACSVQLLMSLAQSATPSTHTGSVTSLVGFCRSLGASIGVAALGSIWATRAHGLALDRVTDTGMSDSGAREVAARLDSPAFVADLPQELREAVTTSYATGLHDAFVVGSVIALAGLGIAFRLKAPRLPDHHPSVPVDTWRSSR